MKFGKRIQRLLSIILVTVMFATVMPVGSITAHAASGTCGDNLTWSLDSEGTLTISGSGAMENYSANSAPWFSDRNEISEVIIRSGVTNIGSYAFQGCKEMTYIRMPAGVSSIGKNAFSGCISLTNITIPSSVTSIENSAFYGCEGLTSIIIPNGVPSIKQQVFYACKNLRTVTIPTSVTSIENNAFGNCYVLANVKYEGTQNQWNLINISSVGNTYLSSATLTTDGLVGISIKTLPTKTVYQIGETLDTTGLVIIATYSDGTTKKITDGFSVSGFSSYSIGIRRVTVSYKYRTTTFDTMVVTGGTCGEALTWVLDGNGTLTVSGSGAMTDFGFCGSPWFDYSSFVKKVVIESGVTSIGSEAFATNFGYLEDVTIANSVTSIGDHAFDTCALTSVNIPDGIVYIGDYAFQDCPNIVTINIPASVKAIGDYAFQGCTKLTGINVDEGNANYSSDASGVLFDENKIRLIQAPGSLLDGYIIPDNVKIISDYAFSACEKLTHITIPDSVTSICWAAFNVCSNLTDVYYCGTDAKWEQISISGGNNYLTNATLHTIEPVITGITVNTTPVKSVYFIGDSLNTTGLSLIVSDSDGTQEIVSDGFSLSGFDSSTAGTKTIEVTYEGFSTSFEVEVVNEQLVGYTISLKGDIAVNVYMQLSEAIISDNASFIRFVFADGDVSEMSLSEAEIEGDNYAFTCNVQAPEMNDKFTVQVITSVCDTQTYTYSVKEYADYILANTEENTEYAKAAPMVRAMLNYGGYSQLQFGHNTDALVNEGLYSTEDDPVLIDNVTVDDSYSFIAPSEDIGLQYYGSSLLLNAETTIRHYFTITGDKDIAEICEKYNFVLGDETVLTPSMRGAMIYIDIKGINAAELDDMFTLVVKNVETEETISVTYSPFSYAKYVLENAIAGTNLMNVIKAMCLYNEAANNYFE